jgi:LacI family transcriptional regulator
MSNLKNLARELGISKTTVSRALNGYPEVNIRTRERVLAAANASGYQANPMARSLALGRTNIFGLIYPMQPTDLGDPQFMKVVGGMSAALEGQGKNFIIAPVSPNKELSAYEQMVRGRRVDGLIVNRTLVDDERVEFLVRKNFPFVVHGRTSQKQPYAWFDYDNVAGMRMAVSYLAGLGHSRIGLLSAALELNYAAQRKEGFIAAMSAAGFAANPAWMLDGSSDRRAGYAAMKRLLDAGERPTAVIVDNHMSGVGAVRAVLDAGLVLGKDMSVIVWGNIEDSLVGAHVTIIDMPELAKAGARMMAMLEARRNGTPAEELQELWQPVLLPGATTGQA